MEQIISFIQVKEHRQYKDCENAIYYMDRYYFAIKIGDRGYREYSHKRDYKILSKPKYQYRVLPLSTMTQYWGDRYNQHAKRLEEKLGIEIPKVELSELKRFREEIPISEDW